MTEVDSNMLENVLRRHPEMYDISKLLSVEAEPAVTEGENYISKIYRLTVTALSRDDKELKRTVILKRKIEIKFEAYPEITNSINKVFNMEYDIYVDILEGIAKYLPKNEDKLWPQCLGFVINKDIYLEDLKEKGFKLANRLIGLDFDHTVIAFKNFALLHAASYLAIANGDINMDNNKIYFTTQINNIEMEYKDYDYLLDVIRKDWGPSWNSTADKLDKIKDNLEVTVNKLAEFDESRLNVLNHSDSWINNFMFKYDSAGKPVSFKFIDFQISHYNSFALDLCFFLHTSISGEMKLEYLDTWIQIYCDTFNSCLDECGSKLTRPTPEMVRKEFKRLAAFSLFVSMRIRPVVMVPPEDHLNINSMLQKTGFDMKKRKIYSNPNYAKVMKIDLPPLLSLVNM